MNGTIGAIRGFREAFTSNSPVAPAFAGVADNWGAYESRLQRYQTSWSFDEGSPYRDALGNARAMKELYSLYSFIRPVGSTVGRLNNLHRTLIGGGALDPLAGDGIKVPSALPIVTESEALRKAIAALWSSSNWQINKGVLAFYGASLGDAAILLYDNPRNKSIRMQPILPHQFEWVGHDPDDLDRITGYIFHEMRWNPEMPAPSVQGVGTSRVADKVRYTERVTLDDSSGVVTYETYRDGRPYAWPGNPADTWDTDWGFVPLVLIQHVNKGLEWGEAEFWSARAKMMELDDLGSMLSDHVRNAVDGTAYATGIDVPDGTEIEIPKRSSRDKRALFTIADPAARIAMLQGDLNISDGITLLQHLGDQLGQDFPELSPELFAIKNEASGRALRERRKLAESKLSSRRDQYDKGTVQAFEMAAALGGSLGYYDGFGIDDYHAPGRPKLKLSIGPRQVFTADALDRLEEDKAQADVIYQQVRNGIPIIFALKHAGLYDDAELEELKAEQVADAARANPDGTLTSQTVIKTDNTTGAPAKPTGAAP